MTINAKMIRSFAVIVTFVLIICGTFIYQLKKVDTSYSNTIDSLLPILNTASKISTDSIRATYYMQNYVTEGDRDLTAYEAVMTEMHESIDRIATTATSEGGKQVVAALEHTSHHLSTRASEQDQIAARFSV